MHGGLVTPSVHQNLMCISFYSYWHSVCSCSIRGLCHVRDMDQCPKFIREHWSWLINDAPLNLPGLYSSSQGSTCGPPVLWSVSLPSTSGISPVDRSPSKKRSCSFLEVWPTGYRTMIAWLVSCLSGIPNSWWVYFIHLG